MIAAVATITIEKSAMIVSKFWLLSTARYNLLIAAFSAIVTVRYDSKGMLSNK